MPKIPVYEGEQVDLQPVRPVMQNTPDVSSGANALARGLGVVAEAADRIDLRNAQDESFKLQNQIRVDWQQYRAKLRETYKGENTAQYLEEANKWWDEAPARYGANVGVRAQALANEALVNYRAAQQADSLAYVEGEQKRAREINFNTTQTLLIDEATKNVNGKNAIPVAEAVTRQLRENAIAYAAAEGYNSDVGEVMAKKHTDAYHTSVALTLAHGPNGEKAAKAYLDKFTPDMSSDMRNSINDRVESIIEQQRQKAIRAMEGAGAKTDFATWYEVQQKILNGEKVNLLDYRGKLSVSDLKAFAVLQEKPAKAFEAKIDADDFNAVADQMKLAPYASGKSEDEKRKLGTLKSRVEQLISLRQAEIKRPMTREEKIALMRTELGNTVLVDHGIFSREKKVPVIQLTADDIAAIQVPDAMRPQLTQEMAALYKQNNNPMYEPSETNMKRYWARKKSMTADFIGNNE